MTIALTLALLIIAFAAAFHLYWALGGRLGFSVSLPQEPDGRPIFAHMLPLWRVGALFVALGLLAVGALALAQAKVVAVPLHPHTVQAAPLLAGTAFTARALSWHRHVGFFKTLRTTRWARYDTRFYCPLFLTLGLSLLYLAIA